MFVIKFEKNSISCFQKPDNTFLTLNVQLNDSIDFKEGNIQFRDNNISLNQGDLFIHNGKKLRSNGGVSDGMKYMLIMLIDIIL